jgi:hypothetical protein
MLPVWIINLTKNPADRAAYRELLGALTPQQQDCWYYSELQSEALTGLDSCRSLLDELISTGRECYNHFQKEGFVIHDWQICLIGAIHEQPARTLFHLIPSLLRECMPSIMGEHVQRGVEINGILYIPHNLNHLPAAERSECALFLEELNTLSEALATEHFNHVVVCQDIQRPDVRFYPELNRQQVTELVFQYLLHLYYAEENRPLLFDRHLDRHGFYSLGAASVYYDSREHKERSALQLLDKLIEALKDPANQSDKEVEDMSATKFPQASIAAVTVLERLQENCQGLNIELREVELNADPHPVKDFFRPPLYVAYYFDYLRFLPARALEFTRAYSHLLTRKLFAQLEKNKEALVGRFKDILSQYDGIFRQGDYRYPTFPQLKATLTVLKQRFEKEKEEVKKRASTEERNVFEVPAYLETYYKDAQTNYTTYSEKKPAEKESAENMKNALKTEPTILGLLNRCFLLGIMLIFVLIPVLRAISPFIIDLGDVAKYDYLWIAVVFLLPFVYQFGFRLRRHFLFVKKQKHQLLAQAWVKVPRKASAKVYDQTRAFYDEIIAACDETLQRYEAIENSLHLPKEEMYHPDAPCTLFNQPLIGGAFQGEKMLLDNAAVGDEIAISGQNVRLSEIEVNHLLKLLNELFKAPENCPYSLSESPDIPLAEGAQVCVTHIKQALHQWMKINEEQYIARVINEICRADDSKLDMTPLFRMAGINGVITNSTDKKGTLLRSYYKPDYLPGGAPANTVYDCNDPSVRSFLMASVWSYPEPNRLDTVSLCNLKPDETALPPPFTTQLTCLFAQYKKQNNFYRLGEQNVPIDKEQLRMLEHAINEMKP